MVASTVVLNHGTVPSENKKCRDCKYKVDKVQICAIINRLRYLVRTLKNESTMKTSGILTDNMITL
jgi:hypothetical protein